MIASQNEAVSWHSIPFPYRITLPVLRGPLAGLWWSPAAGWHQASFLSKRLEDQCTVISKAVGPGNIVLDVGAGSGFFSLLFGKLVAKTGHVFAVDQNPRRTRLIQHHAMINSLSQLTAQGISVGGASEVRHGYADMTIDELAASRSISPTHIRLSISHDDFPTLQGAQGTIENHRPVLFLTTHGEADHHHCCRWLVRLGYELRPLVGLNVSEARQLICTPQPKPVFRAA